MADPVSPKRTIHRHRSLFLSDLHLGSIGARADLVLLFLDQNRAETYFLVGDILDFALPFSFGRRGACDAVLDHLRQRQSEGARLVYLRGNHDPAATDPSSRRHIPVALVDQVMHVAADGRRYLIIHGDKQDRAVFRSRSLALIGTYVESVARLILSGALFGRARRPSPKDKLFDRLFSVLNATFNFGRGHERRLVDLARQHGADGVICGHYHIADLHDRHGLIYANCGDWVTSITCLSEDFAGRLHLVDGNTVPVASPILIPDAQAAHA